MDDHPYPTDIREYLYKILVIGDLGTGKTSIIKRYVHNIFSTNYKSTIGVDFALKVIQWTPDTVIRMQLWDIAGQEKFSGLTRVYYKEAVAALVVYDITRPNTFEAVPKWKADLDTKVCLPGGQPIPVVLLANKMDLQDEASVGLDGEEMERFCEDNGFLRWFGTSAKDNSNIDDAARFLLEEIMQREAEHAHQQAHDADRIQLTQPRPKEGCC
ncbi:rab32, member RAS oncoprotein [Mortierella sp. 14UC]|nr:rab32, member RAS oncoprotein [Mortierella sp. 14UC]